MKVDWTLLSSGNKGLESYDLTGIVSATPVFSWKGNLEKGYEVSLHLDSPDGRELGKALLKGTAKSPLIKITPVTDGKEHQVFLVVKDLDEAEKAEVKWESIRFGVR